MSARLQLSAAQLGIWYGQQLDPDSPVYNTARWVELPATVDAELLVDAVRRAITEIDGLRLRFTEDDEQVWQLPIPDDRWSVGRVDVADPHAWMRADLSTPFDLRTGPVFRTALVNGRFWYLCCHHIAIDGHGFTLVQQRVAQLYTALAAGEELPVSPFPPLHTLLEAEAAYRSSPAFEVDREFWLSRFADRPAPVSLATGAGQPGVLPLRQSGVIAKPVARRLVEMAVSVRATWPEALVAALATFVYRSTGATDVTVGLPSMARLGAATLRIPATTANVLPVRLKPHREISPTELIATATAEMRELRRHQRYRGEDLRRELGLVGGGKKLVGPLVNIKPPAPLLRFGAGTGTIHYLAAGPVDDLTLTAYTGDDGHIQLDFDANPAHYTEAALRTLRMRFLAFLDTFGIEGPAPAPAPTWNGPATQPRTLTELFAEQVAAVPERIAVSFGDRQLSYAELDRKSDQLAQLLLVKGAGPGRIVALALYRSAELIVAMLAVLKSGAAYLPLDPEYPPERLAFMVADARPVLALTERGTNLPVGLTQLKLDELELPDPSTVDSEPLPSSPAYVIYTSGSTGMPKGVVVPHRNVAWLLSSTQHWFHFGPQDVWTFFHSYAFDFSVWEIWGALSSGGRLVVVPSDVARSPREFLHLVADEGVTVLNQTPSAFGQFTVAEEEAGERLPLRTVIFGGEKLEPAKLADWFARHGDTHPSLVNMYGITETTVHVTAHRLGAEDTRSVIGIPLAETRVQVLDADLHPVPAGTPGELYVSGPGLASGYLGRPELTAERFLPDPCGPPGSRIYASGDVGRWTEDGVLEYLGRADDQLKIRGYRIEPAEIVAAALRSPRVRDAAVLADDRDGLLCYVVPADVDPDRLRNELAGRLPAHQVPSVIVAIERLPLTANGKLDRSALPASGAAPVGSEGGTPDQQVLLGLFSEVLGVPSVAATDSFFALGGHSLLATKLIGRVRSVLGAELDIRTLFTEPTPAQLAKRLQRSDRPALRPRTNHGPAELSPGQQRLWFLNGMSGPSATYNLPLAIEISGPLDVTALRAALLDTITRHESLRSIFPARQGKPVQRVLHINEIDQVLDVHTSTPDRIDTDIAQAAQRGFDLTNEIPLRATLFQLAQPREQSVLLLCLHHIAGDDQSLGPLTTDLSRAYVARSSGNAPGWEPLPVHYADYTDWHRRLLGDEHDPDSVLGKELDYWRRTLAELPDRSMLPTDRPRPPVPSYLGDQIPFELDAQSHSGLRELAARHGVSVFMVLHAALATTLHRLGAGSDIAIGTPVAARTDDALGELIGFFANTLVLRTDLSGDPSFTELLPRVRETCLGAYAHQETPFDRLVEMVNPVRSPDRHPLFQVMLSLATKTGVPDLGPGLSAHSTLVPTGTEKFDLTVNLAYQGEGIAGQLEYATDLFDAATATELASRFQRILRAVIADPETPIGRIDVLDDAERDRILHEWNDTAAEISPLTLPEMVEAQVRRTPDAVAVFFEGITLSYAELNGRANRLAHELRELGVGPGRLAGIHLPRGAEQIVALLGVLKAGGAFVPLESSWPARRIADIAASAGLTVVLTDDQVRGSLPALSMPALSIGHTTRTENLPRAAELTDLAYVIYTSGSTGAPKGAMIPHRAISNRLPWQVDLLGLTPDDAVLYKAPLSFDISVNEIFLPLVSGARLVVAAPGGEKDVSYLLELISAQRITFVYLVSTMLELMLERPEVNKATRSLRHLWCGGEVLTPQLYQRFRAHIDAVMYHGYGPAEATIGVCCQVYRGQDPQHGISIGRPNPNNELYVLDAWMNPVPAGVAGELYIGGVQVALGYIGAPERTAEKFVPDPFSGRSGARLYATGDLCRFRRDGSIEFVGRVDNQTKIRGMRVEVEEIEVALAAYPDVRQGAVLVRDSALVAYCVPQTGRTIDGGALREWLSTRLPEYMIPTEYTVLSAFPLMVSGKVDRKALKPPDRPKVSRSFVTPRSDMQRTVARVWKEILGVDVGAQDNFFDLGGHSLLLTRAQAALQRELGRAIPVVDLFTHATVETLATYLEGEATGGVALNILLPLRTEGSEPPLFCVHPASGLAWPFAGLRQHLSADQPIYGIQARGLNEPRPVPADIEEMSREYLDQVRTVAPHGPYRLIGWSFGGVVAHTMATLLQDAGETVELLGMLDSYPAYPWEKLSDDHEQQALRSLLYMSHYDLDALPDVPLDRPTVLATIAEQGGILASLGESTLTAVMDTFVNSAPLQQQARHRTFHGDLMFFTATVNQVDAALTHKDWSPYVDGIINNLDIACAHKDMTHAGPLSIIGKAIASAL